MGFIVKLKKGIQQPSTTTTTSNEIILPQNAITFSVFGGLENNLFGVGNTSYGAINRGTGVIFAGQVQFELRDTTVIVTDNNNNTYDISINFSIKARNGRNGVRSVINPTLLIDLSSALTNITSLSTSFTPSRASKQVGVISKSMIGVTFDDIDINQNGVEEFAVEGNLSLNVINGATPVLIRQSFRDTQLPSIASRIQRFNTTGSLTLNQRFIFGNKSDITSSSASFSVGDDFQTIDYTNNTFNTPNAIYRAGTAIEYDDSLTPTYYFDEGVERITKVEEISFAATTAAPTTTTAAPTTTTAPSEPVIFTSESPVDGGNIVVGSVRQPVSEFNVGLANNVPSGMEFRIRVETSNLILINVENFVDSQNVPIKTTYVNNDLVTQDNVSSGNILYTYDPVITKTVETEVTTGTLAFVIETNINGSFQETDRISYDLSVFTIRAVPTCPNDTNILEFVSNSTNDFQLIFTDDVNYTLGDFNIEANAVEVLQFNPSTTPILLVEDTNTTLIVNVSDANLPAGTYDINVSFTNFACGTYVRTRRITVEEGNFEDGGRGNPLI